MQGGKKKIAQRFPNTELTDPPWKDSLSCEGDTLLRLSFLRLCHGEIGTGDFCLSNLSEQDICLMFFSYQLSQGDSWLICFKGYSLPSLADSTLCTEGRHGWAAEPGWQAALPPHLLLPPKDPRTPSGNQEGTGRTIPVVRWEIKQATVYMSRRQAVGCPNE